MLVKKTINFNDPNTFFHLTDENYNSTLRYINTIVFTNSVRIKQDSAGRNFHNFSLVSEINMMFFTD